MPYIKAADRHEIDEAIRSTLDLARRGARAGEINYIVTRILHEHALAIGADYTAYNECIGILESAKLEFYRRQVAVYEDQVKARNGEVYRTPLPPDVLRQLPLFGE